MTWIDDPAFGSDRPFGPQTLPYGVLLTSAGPAVCVRVGDHALPLRGLAPELGPELAGLVSGGSLDPLLAAGNPQWTALRARITEVVTSDRRPDGAELLPVAEHRMLLPFTVADYVDFYSSKQHAQNVGRMFRPDSEPLLPNWTHLPVGYHGRAGTVVASGTDIERPSGQSRPPGDEMPSFGPSKRLDIEAEVGFVCGGGPTSRVSTAEIADHVFGVALVNDWSARDIQPWEYQPLGPHLAKSFATSIAGWITPLAAFADARVEPPKPDHALQEYLVEKEPWGLDLHLEVWFNGTSVSRPEFRHMSFSPAQQLAHMTVNGATVRPGDLFASGTVSGPEKEQFGSLLELTWAGKEPIVLDGGEQRTFLEDGDNVTIAGHAPGPDGSVVGLGAVTGTIVAAQPR